MADTAARVGFVRKSSSMARRPGPQKPRRPRHQEKRRNPGSNPGAPKAPKAPAFKSITKMPKPRP